jgi:A/G-specific adenine glycosylase
VENILIEEKIKWFGDRLLDWVEDNLRDYPWRRTSNPYSILVAEFLLQRTDADTVAPIYKTFLVCYHTWEKLAIAPVEDVAKL